MWYNIFVHNRPKFNLTGGKKMENFLAELKNTADKVFKKSGELVELSKTKLSIASIKSDISANFKLLGEIVYLSQREGSEATTDEVEEIFARIDALYEKMADLNEAATGLMNKKLCPECDEANETDASFCSRCGYNFPSANKDE